MPPKSVANAQPVGDFVDDLLEMDKDADILAVKPGDTQFKQKISGFQTHEYDGYPMHKYKGTDVSGKHKRKSFNDPDEDAPWKSPGMDYVQSQVREGPKISYRTERMLEGYSSSGMTRKPLDEGSWINARMSSRLQPEFSQRMELCNRRTSKSSSEKADEIMTVEEAADVLMLMSTGSTSNDIKMTDNASQNIPPPAVVVPSSEDQQGDQVSNTAPFQLSYTPDELEAAHALVELSRAPVTRQNGLSEELIETNESDDQFEQRSELLRKIIRDRGHVGRPPRGQPDNMPTWAKRGEQPPDQETKEEQERVQALAIILLENVEGTSGTVDADTLREPLWSVNIKGVDTPEQLEEQVEDARKVLVASRKLLPKPVSAPKAQTKSPSQSPPPTKKRKTIPEAEQTAASKRPRRENAGQKAPEPESEPTLPSARPQSRETAQKLRGKTPVKKLS